MENNYELETVDSLKKPSSIQEKIYSKKQKFMSELVGTTILTFTIEVSLSLVKIQKSFLILIPMTYLFGKISGAHFNPAVSLPMYLRKQINFCEFIYYFLAQFLGSILGFLLTFLCVFGDIKMLYFNRYYSINVRYFYIFLILEIICSLIYVLIFFLLYIKEKKYDFLSVIILGIPFYIFSSSHIIELNPILFFPNIILAIIGNEKITIIWVYLIGPIIGGIAGGFLSKLFE